jgi:ABC-type transport system involved in multi-copper enzyme maturation permease subunit
MRFSALLRKELRESLPWMLLSAIVFLAIGGFYLRQVQLYGRYDWSERYFSSRSVTETYGLQYRRSPLQLVGPILLLTSLGLGLVLGVRHFWIPYLTRTWPFLIHRSVDRTTIIWAKLAAAIISLLISIGIVWVAFYSYSCDPERFTMLPIKRVFIEGWLFILLGLVVYLGTALTGLSKARWYTTKIFGLAFATVVICATIFECRLG